MARVSKKRTIQELSKELLGVALPGSAEAKQSADQFAALGKRLQRQAEILGDLDLDSGPVTPKKKREKKAPAPPPELRIPASEDCDRWLVLGLDPSLSRTGYAFTLVEKSDSETGTSARWLDVGSLKPDDASVPVWIRSKAIALTLQQLLLTNLQKVMTPNDSKLGLIISLEAPTPGNDFLSSISRILHLILLNSDSGLARFDKIHVQMTNASTLRSLMGLTMRGNDNKKENVAKAYTFLDKGNFPNLDTDACDAVLMAIMARYSAAILLGHPETVPSLFLTAMCNATEEVVGKGRNAKTRTKGILHRREYSIIHTGTGDQTDGCEGAGKCLAVGNLVITPSGLLYVDEVFQENGLDVIGKPKAIAHEYPLINREGKFEATTRFTRNGRRPVFAVKTVSGNLIVSTSSHQHLVMSRSGYWVWRRTEKIEPGDYLVTSRTYTVSIGHRADVSDEELYFLGTLLADGSFAPNRVGVTNNDPVVKQHILEHGTAMVGLKPHQYPKASAESFDYHFNSKEAASALYAKMGWAPGVAKDKHLGSFIRRLGTEQIREVLKGYFDCECAIDEFGIEVASASWKLLFEVKTVLQAHFGIITILKGKKVASYPDRDYWRLNLYGPSARLFVERIGFRSDVRRAEAGALVSDKIANSNLDVIPSCGALLEALYDSSETTKEHNFETRDYKGANPKASPTYKSLGTLLGLPWAECAPLRRLQEIMAAGYYYDEVVGVEERGPEPTFDFEVPGTHSFHVANIVTHNSTFSDATICE